MHKKNYIIVFDPWSVDCVNDVKMNEIALKLLKPDHILHTLPCGFKYASGNDFVVY